MGKLQHLQLPIGELIWESETSFYVLLPHKYLTAVEQAFTRIAQLQSKFWLFPQMVVEGNEIRIKYSWSQQLRPVAEEISTSRGHPKINLIRSFKLAESLAIAFSEAASIGLLPPCPYTVFTTSDPEHESSRLYKFPAIPMFTPGIKDWAIASPQLWQWLSPGILLKTDTSAVDYYAAAAFYYGCIGAIVPEHLPIREQFTRYLSHHNFNRQSVEQQLEAAFPKSMQEEEVLEVYHILTSIFLASLETQNNSFLEFIQNKVSVLRLAGRWEHEGNYSLAVQLWHEQEAWNGSESVSWWRVARLYERSDKIQDSQQALMKGLDMAQEDTIEQALNWVFRRLNNEGLGEIQLLSFKALLKRCDEVVTAYGLDSELYSLKVAHLFLRYEGDRDEASRRLDYLATSGSMTILQNLIKVKILLDQPFLANLEALQKSSRLCLESIKLLKLKHFSSFHTLSALSYFYTMDAIANLFAIIRLGDNSYLKDAYKCFTSGIDIAIENNDQYMINNIGQWLEHLITVVEYFPENKLIISASIPAYFETQRLKGVIIEITPGAFPQQPWYDEDLIFYGTER